MYRTPINEKRIEIDWLLIAVTFGLMAIGVAFVCSATSATDAARDLPWFKLTFVRQIVFCVAGTLAAAGLAIIDYATLSRWALVLYWLMILLLVGVFVIGTTRLGATRWIELGFGFNLQPSEFSKIAFILLQAHFLSPTEELRQPRVIAASLGMALLPFVLILKEPDLGSALVFLPVGLTMMFVAGVPKLFLAKLVGAAAVLVIGLVAAILFLPARFDVVLTSVPAEKKSTAAQAVCQIKSGLKMAEAAALVENAPGIVLRGTSEAGAERAKTTLEGVGARVELKPRGTIVELYQRERLFAYFGLGSASRNATPEERRAKETLRRARSYNVEQALISVGSGGLAGKGWRQGTQYALGFLPRAGAHNDFIFSVLAEEEGFVGSAVILALYMVLLFSGIKIASQARDRLGRLLAIGVVALFFTHVFVNIGMNIRLMPVTGIPLPLLSYGGSSVVCSLIAIGILHNVYMHRRSY